jgi:DNA-binding CsgD family transcriptional regulator
LRVDSAYCDNIGACVLDELRHPLLVVDRARAIHLRNRRAAELLERREVLDDTEGRIRCLDAASDPKLEAALREICDGARQRCTLRLGTSGTPGVNLNATGLCVPGGRRLAMITVLLPDAFAADAEVLATMFSLTPAEGRVAGHIAQGWSPKQIADACGVSTSTVRSQIRSLFQKTGVRRQPDLVRLMLVAAAL